MIPKVLKILKKTSKMEFISVKLQAYSVQIAHHFRKLFQKLVFLKEHFSKSLWYSIVSIECGPAVHKTRVNVRPDWRSAENSLLVETFFSKNGSLEFIPWDFIKNELHHRDYLAWVLKVPSLIFWKTFFEVSLLFLLYRRL